MSALTEISNEICTSISTATGKQFVCKQQQASGGGCINSTFSISDGCDSYFVKLNRADLSEMFTAEADGLNEIRSSDSIRVPEVICTGSDGNQAYLVLEHLQLGHGDSHSHEQLGDELAQMHRHCSEKFGWFRDNTIGSTPQHNQQRSDWIEFWRSERLEFQLQLAANNGYSGKLQQLGEQLLNQLDDFFISYTPQASLLHGDLWSGNYAIDQNGCPVIFDPAVYYGDREADLAMTELFGGFNTHFYQAYQASFPLDAGYQQRKTLYNLYHVLNHLNLFGGGYLSQAESMLARLLAESR